MITILKHTHAELQLEKNLGKLKQSIEDSEFALRLKPQNQEIKKQYAEVKSLYEKEILQKALETQKNSIQGMQKGGKPVTEANGHEARAAPNTTTPRTGVAVVQGDHTKINHRTRKQVLNASVQDLASRAVVEAARNITPPKSAYEFEVSWRGFSGDCALQACLLKAISAIALPQIFKNALSAPLLMGIIMAVATFLAEDMDLAVKYLQNLTMDPRFDRLIMCLSSTNKAELQKIWNETFCSEATPIEYAEFLDNLRSKYCLNQ